MNGHSNGSPNGQHAGETRTLAERLNIHRKQSQPMAPPFMVSAPGKVIVFGEHSVVYGKVGCASPQIRPFRVAARAKGRMLTDIYFLRLPLLLRFLFDLTSMLRPSPNRSEQFPSDSLISTLSILGTLTTCPGRLSTTPRRRSHTTIL